MPTGDFYPRPPRGGRLDGAASGLCLGEFLSTPSARRATRDATTIANGMRNFYPRPPRGGRPPEAYTRRSQDNFYPRPPRGGRLMSWNIPDSRKQFLSTPSARRATGGLGPTTREPDDFYPRPPRGGRRPAHSSNTLPVQFLSTPSARRATDFYFGGDSYEQISIHALREEGDEMQERVCTVLAHFYPRPPRGGRPAQLARASAAEAISIHALREEGDLGTVAVTTGDDLFLSTPSARRATVSVQTIYHYIKFLSTPSARRATRSVCLVPCPK